MPDVYLDVYVDAASQIDAGWFVASAALFGLGYVSAYPVARYDVDVLTWYPLWIWRRVRDLISPSDPWHRVFVFLLTFNSVSLLANVFSGAFVVLPPAFGFLLGLNLGVIAYEEAGPRGMLALTLLNPVAWLELPAAFASLALGFAFAGDVVRGGFGGLTALPDYLSLYAVVVLPLLVAAALLESTLISLVPSGDVVESG